MADTYPATLSTPRANTTLTTDITVQAREVDFVSRFTDNLDSLREIMGIMNPVRKAPGTTLTSYKASITLEDGTEHAGCCSLYPNEDPLEECDDFAYFWEEDDDYYIDDNESEEE